MALAPIRVLIVDDDEPLLRATARTLKRAGCEVVTASSPFAALDTLRGQLIDIIVSDLEMPGMCGDALCREVQTFRPTPFILLSGNSMALVPRGQACGATVMLCKPYEPKALIEQVEIWANQREVEGT